MCSRHLLHRRYFPWIGVDSFGADDVSQVMQLLLDKAALVEIHLHFLSLESLKYLPQIIDMFLEGIA